MPGFDFFLKKKAPHHNPHTWIWRLNHAFSKLEAKTSAETKPSGQLHGKKTTKYLESICKHHNELASTKGYH